LFFFKSLLFVFLKNKQTNQPETKKPLLQKTLLDLRFEPDLWLHHKRAKKHTRKTSASNCCGLALAGNKGPRSCSIAPPPAGVERRMKRKRQNSWVGIRTVEQNEKGSKQ